MASRLAALCTVALLCGPAAAQESGAAAPPQSAITAPSRGIRKVITLLQEMRKTVEREAKEDKASYDEYKCWCETSENEKKAAVEEAEKKVGELEAFLEEAAGLGAELKTEIAGLEADIQDDQDALATATSLREKEHKAFLAAEADLKECLGALAKAIEVLSKVQLLQKKGSVPAVALAEARESLLQLRHKAKAMPAAAQFRDLMQKDLFDVLGSMSDEDGPARGTFLQGRLKPSDEATGIKTSDEELGKAAKPNDLHGAAAGAKSYNSRSGQILGVLGGMSDAFQRDLAAAQRAELQALIDYQHLRAAKLREIAAATQAKNDKETALADLGVKVSRSKDELGETKDYLAENQKFLVDMAEMCKTVDEEYAARVKARDEELRALAEVLKILTDDDARDLYAKTMDFMQVGMVANMDSAARMERRAMNMALQRVLRSARKHKDWMLIALAARARLDNFSKVKEMMDKMLAELKEQQKLEYEKWEACKTELDTTDDKIKEATKTKNELEDKKLGLENTIKQLNAEIAQLTEDIAATEASLKKAGEDRKAENELFQASVADQRATAQILKKAQTRLQQFYNSKTLLQGDITPAWMSAPTKPPAYSKAKNAGAIMQLLAKIISEAESAEAALVVDEQHSQKNYAMFAADATASIEAMRATVTDDQKALEAAEGALSETEEALLANAAELTKLDELLQNIHLDCDYILKYFELRQQARKEEMDAIVDAKAILSGADFGSAPAPEEA